MKNKILVFICLLASTGIVRAQNQFDGIRSSDYLGVKSVFFNPANIADNRYRWDVNLFSINAGAGDLTASFSIKTLKNNSANQFDSVLFGTNSKAASAYAGIDFMGPSLMISLNKKTTIAFTTRSRVMINIHDIDGKLVNAIQQGSNEQLPYTMASGNNQSVAANGWTDFGVSLGRVLIADGHQSLKLGVTLKYLAGYTNNYIQLNNISGTVNQDANGTYLTSTTGLVQIGEGGVDLNKLTGSNVFQFSGSGIGGDLGVVYTLLKHTNSSKKKSQPYKLKFSLSLLDLGSINYKANPSYTAGYSVNISGTQKYYANNLKDSSLTGIKNALDQSPYFKNLNQGNNSYAVGLPTTLVGNIDINLISRFYLDLDGRLSFHNYNKYSNPFYQNNFTITPRFEGRIFGAYIPLNINSMTGFNAGLALRAGPLFVGIRKFA